MSVQRSNLFKRQYQKRAKGALRDQVDACLLLFEENPNDTRLKPKRLKGPLKGVIEIRVTKDHRILIRHIKENEYFLVGFGTHDQLFRNH